MDFVRFGLPVIPVITPLSFVSSSYRISRDEQWNASNHVDLAVESFDRRLKLFGFNKQATTAHQPRPEVG